MPEHPTILLCPLCGAEVPPSRRHSPERRQYCSRSCATKIAARAGAALARLAPLVRPCVTCGADMVLTTSHDQTRKYNCSMACARICAASTNRAKGRRGPNAPGWKGGRWVTLAGYVRLQMTGYPGATKGGSIFEHRLVMERKLGRLLRAGEEVHHINGVRDDNRPENLELWFVRRQPKGIRLGEAPHCPTCRCEAERHLSSPS